MTTFEILQNLQNEVGSRRAGTEGEMRAQQWLRSQCEALELPVELNEFLFIGNEYYRPLLTLGIITWILGCIGLSLAGYVFLSLAGFVVLFIFLTFMLKRIDVRLARTPSQNVLAGLNRSFADYTADAEKRTAVLVCGHYDTPRNFPPLFSKMRGAMRFLGPLAILGLILWILTLIVEDVWDSLGTVPELAVQVINVFDTLAFVLAAPFLLMMFVLTIYRMLSPKSDSPGTDDNGSGTALVLALAHRFKEKPTENIDLFFGWWGAEEMGLFGSRQFVRQRQKQLDKDKLHIINADCVGVGEYMTVHTGQGTINRKKAEQSTITRLEKAAEENDVKTIRSWESVFSGGSSDQAGWIDRGFKNTSLLLRANRRSLSVTSRLVAAILRIKDPNQYELDHIHTPEDTLEMIIPDVLESSTDVAEAYIRAIDREGALREEGELNN